MGETRVDFALTWLLACATAEVQRLLHAEGLGAATTACDRHTQTREIGSGTPRPRIVH